MGNFFKNIALVNASSNMKPGVYNATLSQGGAASKIRGTWLVVVFLVLLLAGCAVAPADSEAPSLPRDVQAGNSLRGEALFKQPIIGTNRAAGCITCHALTGETVLVGPPLQVLTSDTLKNPEGLPPAEFLQLSIVEPDRHVTSGFEAGVMIQTYRDELSPQEIADLVAFLLTPNSE